MAVTTALSLRALRAAACLCALAFALAGARAGEFAVSPIRVDLKPGAMSETITITNDASTRLRVSMKLMEWTQDENGQDVYRESSDLVYFPRQMDVEPNARRLVRIGARSPAAVTERTYRLFIEEDPEPAGAAARAQVAVFFRFGVPVFLPPAVGKPQPEVQEPTLAQGRFSVRVRNTGNQHFRLTRVTISDGAGYAQELTGWYSLAGTERTYAADIPREVCRKARALRVLLEGENLRFERSLNVEPAQCA
jgi:fimbrial chaperone protein